MQATARAMRAQSAVIKLWFETAVVFFSRSFHFATQRAQGVSVKHVCTKWRDNGTHTLLYRLTAKRCLWVLSWATGTGAWIFIVLKCMKNSKKEATKTELLQMLINCVISFAEMPFRSDRMSLYCVSRNVMPFNTKHQRCYYILYALSVMLSEEVKSSEKEINQQSNKI